jgi:hypothetical protein
MPNDYALFNGDVGGGQARAWTDTATGVLKTEKGTRVQVPGFYEG